MEVNKSQYLLDLMKKEHEEWDEICNADFMNNTTHQWNGGVTTSFVFKMNNVEPFLREKLSPYLLDIKEEPQFEITRFLIDKSKLTAFTDILDPLGRANAFCYQANTLPDIYSEEVEIDVFKNNYAVIVDTIYIRVPKRILDVEGEQGLLDVDPVLSIAKELAEPLYVQSRPEFTVLSSIRKEYSKLDQDSDEYIDLLAGPKIYDAKYYEADLHSNSYAAKLIEIIINPKKNAKVALHLYQ